MCVDLRDWASLDVVEDLPEICFTLNWVYIGGVVVRDSRCGGLVVPTTYLSLSSANLTVLTDFLFLLLVCLPFSTCVSFLSVSL